MGKHLGRFLAIVATSVFIYQTANAASLVGKVIDVNDGDEITIFNLNRPVRIRLIGIDAPEKDQVFGPNARQHLADLVLEKVVVVEYSGIGEHGSLIGRVLLNDTDISAQMVRDGAAWFEPNHSHLSDTQREIYFESEQAARREKRGLWQSENPVAPWEFVKAEELKRNAVTSTPAATTQTVKHGSASAELTSLGLVRTNTGAVAKPQSALVEDEEDWGPVGTLATSWHPLKPTGESFSVLVPSSGKQKTKAIAVGNQTINVNYFMGRDGYTLFFLMWTTGPNQEQSNDQALKAGLAGIYKGMDSAFQKAGVGRFDCEPLSDKNISSGGFVGREFDLSACPLRGIARVYTRVVGGNRQMYVGATFYNEVEGNASKFMNSFRITPEKSSKQSSSAGTN